MSQERFDAVVVGSGFGGSVIAYRLSKAGRKVLLLERGKAYPPNSFPRSPDKMRKNFWDPSAGLFGLLDVWSFRHMDSMVASGLGGGSLIYANVLLRKDRSWFQSEDPLTGELRRWPIQLDELEPHYEQVEAMQHPQLYPYEALTPKTRAFRLAAERMGCRLELPKLAVTFANPGKAPAIGEPIDEPPNLHGRLRHTCRLCGECNLGCNYGSKNTLDYTFLSRAVEQGLTIRTESEVKSFKPLADGSYEVIYADHRQPIEQGRTSRESPERTVRAGILILAAGTLGTNYLLLKNRDYFPAISKQLGNRFSGNGDTLTLVIGADDGSTPIAMDSTFGPVITCMIRVPDMLDGTGAEGPGFYFEDAGYPVLLSWIVQTLAQPSTLRAALSFGVRYLKGVAGWEKDTDLDLEISRVLENVHLTSNSTPTLAMGRDVPEGRFFLNAEGWLDLEYTGEKSAAYLEKVFQFNKRFAAALNAECVKNPLSFLQKLITVHPLGGCAMSEDIETGVTRKSGQVFGYDNLYVVDGAALPGPVGANPSLTISANSHRVAAGILGQRV